MTDATEVTPEIQIDEPPRPPVVRSPEVRLLAVLAALLVVTAVALAGFFAVTGSPPFAPFVSEFTILNAAFGQGHWKIATAFLVLLGVTAGVATQAVGALL